MAKAIIAQKIVGGNDADQKAPPSSLWLIWWNVIILLQPAFSYFPTFMWFAVAVAGITVRTDTLGGVTSIVRALNFSDAAYRSLLKTFHSSAVRLDELVALWTRIVLRLFPDPVRINGRVVLVGDGTKATKFGKKMPAVKRLHQHSEHKPDYIMGHVRHRNTKGRNRKYVSYVKDEGRGPSESAFRSRLQTTSCCCGKESRW